MDPGNKTNTLVTLVTNLYSDSISAEETFAGLTSQGTKMMGISLVCTHTAYFRAL